MKFSFLICILTAVVAFAESTGEDVVLKAMQDEMARSMEKLQIENAEKPYFIQYLVSTQEAIRIGAKFGALTESNRVRSRSFQVGVRIGNYGFDDSGLMTRETIGAMAQGGYESLVLEADYEALRHRIWLATDDAYKQALERYSLKQAFVKNKVEKETLPDFTKEVPVDGILPLKELNVNQAEWEKKVREWSAIFRKYGSIQESEVRLDITVVHEYLLNSEGTRIRRPFHLLHLNVSASTQSIEGVRLQRSVPLYTVTPEQIPSAESVAAWIETFAQELTELRNAVSATEVYSGPALFTGQAAAEMIAQVFVPHLSGQRSPLVEDERVLSYMGLKESELIQRIGRPVLPDFISVKDDPTVQTFDTKALIGNYSFDDEGVPASSVQIVENGILRNLLNSRSLPRKETDRSNGHGRWSNVAILPHIGNLFIETTHGKSDEELKQELRSICRAQNLPYGILIRSLQENSFGGFQDLMSRMLSGPGASGANVSAPVLAYRIYTEDGREELIRGIQGGSVSLRALRDIVAAGNHPYVHQLKISNNRNPFSQSSGQPASIVSPALLLEEIELQPRSGSQEKPSILSHPYFQK